MLRNRRLSRAMRAARKHCVQLRGADGHFDPTPAPVSLGLSLARDHLGHGPVRRAGPAAGLQWRLRNVGRQQSCPSRRATRGTHGCILGSSVASPRRCFRTRCLLMGRMNSASTVSPLAELDLVLGIRNRHWSGRLVEKGVSHVQAGTFSAALCHAGLILLRLSWLFRLVRHGLLKRRNVHAKRTR